MTTAHTRPRFQLRTRLTLLAVLALSLAAAAFTPALGAVRPAAAQSIPVYGAIRTKWLAGCEGGVSLGAPLTPEQDAPLFQGVRGRFQEFQGGSIYWHPDATIGAHCIYGLIRTKWLGLGGAGAYGYPVTDERAAPGGGRSNDFQQGGSIYWHPDTGAHAVYGDIRAKWLSQGGAGGSFGYPTTDEQAMRGGGRWSQFSRGVVYWSPQAGARAVPRTTVRVHAIRVADTDGGRAAHITPSHVTQWLDKANASYAMAGIEFAFDPNINGPDWSMINNTAINNLSSQPTQTWLPSLDGTGWSEANAVAGKYPGRLVIFFRWGKDTAPTGNGFAFRETNFAAMPGFPDTTVKTGKDAYGQWIVRQNIWLLGHEMGHYFGLDHTFPGQNDLANDTPAKAANYISWIGGTASALDGDGLADTPPDAGTAFYINQGWDPCAGPTTYWIGNLVFQPDRQNVMSYFVCDPMGFTPMQVDRMRQALAARHLNSQ